MLCSSNPCRLALSANTPASLPHYPRVNFVIGHKMDVANFGPLVARLCGHHSHSLQPEEWDEEEAAAAGQMTEILNIIG